MTPDSRATTTSTAGISMGYPEGMNSQTVNTPNDIAILGRVLTSGDGPLPPEVARYFLGLSFSAADKARMHELAEKNQEGKISPAELEELDGYVRAGDVLAILQLKARRALNATPVRNGHG
jgi:hypothetical protein